MVEGWNSGWGKLIADARDGRSQAWLADETGIDASLISRYEREALPHHANARSGGYAHAVRRGGKAMTARVLHGLLRFAAPTKTPKAPGHYHGIPQRSAQLQPPPPPNRPRISRTRTATRAFVSGSNKSSPGRAHPDHNWNTPRLFPESPTAPGLYFDSHQAMVSMSGTHSADAPASASNARISASVSWPETEAACATGVGGGARVGVTVGYRVGGK